MNKIMEQPETVIPLDKENTILKSEQGTGSVDLVLGSLPKVTEKGSILGKFLNLTELEKAYESLQAEFTRKSQRLATLEQQALGTEKKNALEKVQTETEEQFFETVNAETKPDALVSEQILKAYQKTLDSNKTAPQKVCDPEGITLDQVNTDQIGQEAKSLTESQSGHVQNALLENQGIKENQIHQIPDSCSEKAPEKQSIGQAETREEIIKNYLISLATRKSPPAVIKTSNNDFVCTKKEARSLGEINQIAKDFFQCRMQK